MGNEPATGTSDAVFGRAATFNTDVGFSLDVSPDKKAFTAAFSGLAISHYAGSPPIVTRVFSFTLPLSGVDRGVVIPFFVQGFVISGNGANAHLVFSINDQTTVVDFPDNSNTSFLQQLDYKVGSASEVRLTLILFADRDSKSQAQANLTVDTIDTDAAKVRRESTAPTMR